MPARPIAPIDWASYIGEAIANERELRREVLAHVIAEMRAEQADELERATRSLNIELGELRATLAELRAVLATDKARKGDGIVDLPNPISPQRVN
jgi:hypothetical protein